MYMAVSALIRLGAVIPYLHESGNGLVSVTSDSILVPIDSGIRGMGFVGGQEPIH